MKINFKKMAGATLLSLSAGLSLFLVLPAKADSLMQVYLKPSLVTQLSNKRKQIGSRLDNSYPLREQLYCPTSALKQRLLIAINNSPPTLLLPPMVIISALVLVSARKFRWVRNDALL